MANSTIQHAFDTVKQIRELCSQTDKELLVYLSMGFGNPYGDEWNVEIVMDEKLVSGSTAFLSVGVAPAHHDLPALCHSICGCIAPPVWPIGQTGGFERGGAQWAKDGSFLQATSALQKT